MTRPRRSEGFSLIEALVVLAVGGMALSVIFSIGVKAGDTGFSLGRRAMSAADLDVAVSDLRAVMRSFELRPVATFRLETDTPLRGETTRIEGRVVMERATQCAPQGWSGPMILSVEPVGEGAAIYCQAGATRRELLTTRSGRPAFSYSVDGFSWTPSYSNAPPERAALGDLRSLDVRMRLSGGGEIDVVEHLSSGRPGAWIRFDAPE